MTLQPQERKKVRSYLKYSGLAFQMAGVIGLSLWCGTWCDRQFGFEKPICTILLMLISFTAFLYKLYIDLNKPS